MGSHIEDTGEGRISLCNPIPINRLHPSTIEYTASAAVFPETPDSATRASSDSVVRLLVGR